MYWAESKRITRNECDYYFQSLQTTVPRALDSIPLVKIRRYQMFCFRYMDAYRHGLGPKAAAFAVKKYHGHRMIPNPNSDIVKEIQREMDARDASDE
jgi:hypothetical protein